MLQESLVALAVLAAAAYATWSLTPAGARFSLLSRLDAALAEREAAAGSGGHPGLLRSRVLAPLLRRAAPAGGCGGCGSNPATAAAPRRPPRRPRRP
jgi:hypothetical protein